MLKQPACQRHGGTFETSPVRKSGEVSLVQPPVENGGTPSYPPNGTACAIDSYHLGGAADSERRSGRGGARNRADRESLGLNHGQVANLKAAKEHAYRIGLPFTRMVTIHWQAAGVPLKSMVVATGRYTDLLSKTLARHDCESAYVWVHEGGHGKGGHCHLLAHVPAELVPVISRLQRGWLRRITAQPYRNGVILSRPIGGRLGLEKNNPELHAANLEVAFAYLCKGAPQAILDYFGIEREHRPGGLVIGRRCSTSQNIGAKARMEHT